MATSRELAAGILEDSLPPDEQGQAKFLWVDALAGLILEVIECIFDRGDDAMGLRRGGLVGILDRQRLRIMVHQRLRNTTPGQRRRIYDDLIRKGQGLGQSQFRSLVAEARAASTAP